MQGDVRSGQSFSSESPATILHNEILYAVFVAQANELSPVTPSRLLARLKSRGMVIHDEHELEDLLQRLLDAGFLCRDDDAISAPVAA